MTKQELRNATLNYPKTLNAFMDFSGFDPQGMDDNAKITALEEIYDSGDFHTMVDFFKSKSFHIGIITTPRGAAYPWITGPSFIDAPLVAYKDETNGWLKAIQMAADILEKELPDALIPPAQMATSGHTLKTITKEDVEIKALELAGSNDGYVTNLMIKKALRDDGFYADQRTVASFMDELHNENHWDFDYNGEFRTYNIPAPDDSLYPPINDPETDDLDDEDDSGDDQNNNFFRPSPPIPKKFNSGKIGDWLVRSKDNSTPAKVYKQTTWLQAKKDYASLKGIAYFDVRIRKA